MKKSLLRTVSMLLLLGILTACTPVEEKPSVFPTNSVATSNFVQDVSETIFTSAPEVTPTEEVMQTNQVAPEPSTGPDDVIPEDSSFSIYFIDVGQADATLVECDGQYIYNDIISYKKEGDINSFLTKKANGGGIV